MTTVTFECVDCGAEWERDLPAMLPPTFYQRQTRCEECHRKRDEAERELERERERREREDAAAKRRSKMLDILHGCGVNVWEHAKATLENFDTSQSGSAPVEAAREFLADARSAGKYDPVRGLYLFGDTGCGKSHLAVAVAREFLSDPDVHPDSVVYDHALRLIGRIQRTYSSSESAEEVLERRIDAKLWILDDLGTEAPSADVVRRLTEIFTERAMRPTLVTSNLPPDQLEHRNPEFFRVVSRLGPRYFRTVRVKGDDQRFRPAA